MSNITVTGNQSYFNEDVKFFKDIYVYGNLYYDFQAKEKEIFGDIEVTGNITGNLIGNVTGNITGNLIGNVTGDITGNVSSVGVSTFSNVGIVSAGITTAYIQNLRTLDGGKHNQISFGKGTYSTIRSGITWNTGFNGTTQILGSVSGATGSNVKAIQVSIWYMHNGTTDHGYLTGWYFQTGKTFNLDGMYNDQAHYNWYFNIFETPLIIPWDPTGTQSLSIYVSSAFNTNTNNEYRIFHTGVITQE